MINNINALEKQGIRKDENTLFLNFFQRVFLGFYQGFMKKMKQGKNFSLLFLKNWETLLQSTLNAYKKQKLHMG